jgi:hypothetical protein
MVELLKPQTRRPSGRRGVAMCGAYGGDDELPERRRSPATRALPAVTSRWDMALGLGHATHSQEGRKEGRTHRERGLASHGGQGRARSTVKPFRRAHFGRGGIDGSSTLHGGAGMRWMQLGGARCGASHGGGVRSAVLRQW